IRLRKPLAHDFEHLVRLVALLKGSHLDLREGLLGGRWHGGFFGHDHTHPFRPILHYPNTVGSGTGEVDDTPLSLRVGSTVVDLDLHLLPILWIFHHHFGTERECTMRRRHLLLREAVTIGGLAPGKLFPIPGRLPMLNGPPRCRSLPAHKHEYRSDYQHGRPSSRLKHRTLHISLYGCS